MEYPRGFGHAHADDAGDHNLPSHVLVRGRAAGSRRSVAARLGWRPDRVVYRVFRSSWPRADWAHWELPEAMALPLVDEPGRAARNLGERASLLTGIEANRVAGPAAGRHAGRLAGCIQTARRRRPGPAGPVTVVVAGPHLRRSGGTRGVASGTCRPGMLPWPRDVRHSRHCSSARDSITDASTLHGLGARLRIRGLAVRSRCRRTMTRATPDVLIKSYKSQAHFRSRRDVLNTLAARVKAMGQGLAGGGGSGRVAASRYDGRPGAPASQSEGRQA